MAAHLLGLNYEIEGTVNIFKQVLNPQITATIFMIWPQSILTKNKADTTEQNLNNMAIM